MIYFFSSMIF